MLEDGSIKIIGLAFTGPCLYSEPRDGCLFATGYGNPRKRLTAPTSAVCVAPSSKYRSPQGRSRS